MARDVADVLGNAVGRAAREAAKSIQANAGKNKNGLPGKVTDMVSGKMDGLSGSKGLAAGVGLAAAAPLVAKGAGKLVRGIGGGGDSSGDGPMKKMGEKVGGKVAEKAGGGKGGPPGVGKGRRMPIQQDIDIGVPVADVYKHWTNYEEWPTFMHRLQNVSQDDKKHVAFKTKIWGISKEFSAEIEDERENERIKWKVTDGVTHTGVVTFHELGPRLTRVELNLDVEPGSLIEKAARGMRHVKRAVRADMARFKAYVLMEEEGRASSDTQSSSSRSRSTSSRSTSARKRSASSGSKSSSGRKSASGRKSTSASGRKSSSGRKSTTASGRKSSTSGARKSSANGGQKRSSSSRTRASSSSSSSNGRSSSSRTRASSNGRSRSGSARKRSGTRS
jgi:uncharacterized membrane protein